MDSVLAWIWKWSGDLELAAVIIVLAFSCAFSVDTMNVGVIQRFGKFVRLVRGLSSQCSLLCD